MHQGILYFRHKQLLLPPTIWWCRLESVVTAVTKSTGLQALLIEHLLSLCSISLLLALSVERVLIVVTMLMQKPCRLPVLNRTRPVFVHRHRSLQLANILTLSCWCQWCCYSAQCIQSNPAKYHGWLADWSMRAQRKGNVCLLVLTTAAIQVVQI